jgi:hypothetical protein
MLSEVARDDDDCSNRLATTAHIDQIGQRPLELSATHLQQESCNFLQTILEKGAEKITLLNLVDQNMEAHNATYIRW